MRRRHFLAAGALLPPLLSSGARVVSAAPPPEPITPALVDAASKEGKVTYYTAMDLSVAEPMAKAFEAKYPAIKVAVETIPPAFAMGGRSVVAGLLMAAGVTFGYFVALPAADPATLNQLGRRAYDTVADHQHGDGGTADDIDLRRRSLATRHRRHIGADQLVDRGVG